MAFEHFPNIRYSQLTDEEFTLMDRLGLTLKLIHKSTKMDVEMFHRLTYERGLWVWCPFVFPEQLDELVVKYNISVHRGHRFDKITKEDAIHYRRYQEIEVFCTMQAGGTIKLSEKCSVEVKENLSYDDSYKAYATAVFKLLNRIIEYTALRDLLLNVPDTQCYFPGVSK